MKRILRTAGFCLVVGMVGASLASGQMAGGNADLGRLNARLNQIAQDHERLIAMLEQNQQVLDSLIRRLGAIEAKLAQSEATGGATASLKAEVAKLRDDLATERTAREKSISELISSVSKEISRASSSGGSSAPVRPVVPSQGNYTVAQGDTLSTISQAFGISVKSLKDANQISGDIIRPGQKLIIPAK